MDRQCIRIRRVGSVTFGVVLMITGVLFLIATFFPGIEFIHVFRFWPIILIMLGVEVLLGSRQKTWEILNAEGKIIEQNKVIYDVPAILLTILLTFFSIIMGLVNWAFYHGGSICF